MTPRRRVVVRSAIALMMVVGALVAGVGYTALRTGPGRKWVERQVASALANAMGGRGSIVVHGLDLVPIGSFAADSIVRLPTVEVEFPVAELYERLALP